ncbi:MAG: hypothetical protein LBK45_04220 [Tannerellaceae bacterium]|jgi:hypothetical protein|nr:hypothetical protein [Tannerellaceae bacterium]
MAKTGSLKLPDKDFLAFAINIHKQSDDHLVDWSLDEARVKRLKGIITNAQTAYNENLNPVTRNQVTVNKKNLEFGELKHFLSLFINYLESEEEVPEEGLALMHLRPRSHPAYQPLPVPAEAPLIETTVQHDEITVYVTRMEHGQPAQGVQLQPYHGFMLKWKFEEEADWHIEISTRLHHTLFFDAKDEARRVILAVAWINPRLQEGPWTDSITKVVG